MTDASDPDSKFDGSTRSPIIFIGVVLGLAFITALLYNSHPSLDNLPANDANYALDVT